ncbi:serine/threonine protein kinase [Cladophialophora psammophila CBS 110553]|uniref:Serine/threonine protein kinase n=1 Tax=Cladophialophora psammophila CBS 110553 TaxID=1182543 RepID=W9VK69_9EURO|nr:serine/threonine protein kinase [Cladophialophora psammophila CBS 110553]EXJ53415.1 serine/threonine protein kinase [Cladophialophora psammophila CBS 110553]
MHPASRVNQSLNGLRNPVEYEAQTLSTSKFHILLKELDVQVFQDLSGLLRDEKYLTSGASFDISVAIARSNSQFQPFSDGTARPRWIEGSVIALKRLKPPRTRPGIRESTQFPRIHRSLIHELRILSHTSLRNHRNLINLFGIAWERHQDVSGIDYMRPVVVQSCATRGNLRDYLRAKTDDKELPWRTKMLFCKDILDGLVFLHASNVIHGDIKCDNILLEEDSNTRLVAKLTDFGFSVIVPLSVRGAPILEVEMLSGTEEYMAPEAFIAKQNGTMTLSTSVAFSSDIYAFGLTACEIALNGQYVFSAVLSPSEAPEVTPSADQDSKSAEAWIKSKIRDNADDLLLRPLKTLIDHVEGTDEYRLSEVLDMTFRRRAEDRATDIATIRAVMVGYDEEATIPTAGSPVSLDKSSNLSLSFLFKQRYEIFNVNGQPVQLNVHDASILQDLKVKASPAVSLQATNIHKMNTLSLSDVASVSFCAYQMFICHLHGYGVPFDFETAVQYLKASAHGGYVPALVAVSNFRDLKVDPLFARNDRIQDALEAQVSSGPRFGMLLWLVACRTLRRDDPEAYQRSFQKLNSSGYAELGEAPDCYTQLDAETFAGPSVEYQWIARGTMPLVLRLLPVLSVQEFTMGFENGCFPSGAVNYNNETALYMCCRAGEKEKVLALLDTYEWARTKVTVANKQGRFPLHWLWAFERDDPQAVAEALLSNGADVDAIDEDGFRAIDYAIVALCPDVVSLLLTKSEAISEKLRRQFTD